MQGEIIRDLLDTQHSDMLSSGSKLGTCVVTVSLLTNAYFLLPKLPAAETTTIATAATAACSSGADLQCDGNLHCSCDGRPLGAGTAGSLSENYPFGNKSLASIYDTGAFLMDKLLPLSQFKAKAILIGNTASN